MQNLLINGGIVRSNSKEGSNFRKKTAKKFVLPHKFQNVRFEVHEKFTIFRTFTVLAI